jgi:MFS family permease
MVHVFELSIPVFIAIWLFEFGVTPAVIGITVTVGYALFGLGSLPSGILADYISSKKLILFCLLGMATSFYVLSISQSLIMISFALFLWGTAASIYHPTGLSLISRKVESPGVVYAYHGIAGNIGTAIGPLITILLLGHFNWRVAASILATISLLVALLSYRIKIDDSFGDSTTNNINLNWGVIKQSLTFLPVVLSLLFSVNISLAGISFDFSNYFYAGILIIGAFGQYVAGILSDHFKPELPLLFGYSILGLLALIFLPASQSGIAVFALFGAVLGFFLFFIQPLQATLISRHTPPETRGLSFGITFTGIYGIGAFGGAAAGGILTYFSPSLLFSILAAIMLFASVLIYVIKTSKTIENSS